jgi:hypothetical protein
MTQHGGKEEKETCWFVQMFVVLEQIKKVSKVTGALEHQETLA